MNHEDKRPLSSEELEREAAEAGRGTFLSEDDAPGHTLPASESGGGGESRSGGRVGGAGILPPD